jgi:hypothetical protein
MTDPRAHLHLSGERSLEVDGVAPDRRDLGGLPEALAEAGVMAHLSPHTRSGSGWCRCRLAGRGLLLGTRLVRPGAAVVVIAAGRGRRLLAAGAVATVLATVLVRRRR